MYSNKSALERLTGKTAGYIKKTAVSVVVFASVSLGLASLDRVSADSSKKNNNTVYYVYLEDEYVGTISDKDIIEKLKDKKISEFKDEMDKKYKLTVGSDLHSFRNRSAPRQKQMIGKSSRNLMSNWPLKQKPQPSCWTAKRLFMSSTKKQPTKSLKR